MYFDYQLLTEGLTVRTARSFEWWNCFLEFGESVKNDEHDGEGGEGGSGADLCKNYRRENVRKMRGVKKEWVFSGELKVPPETNNPIKIND